MNLNKTNYRGVIIGTGQVASDYDFFGSDEITTHAHGLVAHQRTELAGFFDIDQNKAKAAARKWQTTAFAELREMFMVIKPEIVSVCTPDQTHAKVLEELLKFKPKIVIAEKPLTTRLADTKKILRLYRQAKVPILVNYRRRFDPVTQLLRDKIMTGEYGSVLGAAAVYSKGLLHSGSHMIDLARFLFGDVISTKPLFSRQDYLVEDRTVGGFLIFERCPQFHLIAGDEGAYSLFELDIVIERARIRFVNEGLIVESQVVIEDSPELLQKGYKVLGRVRRQKTGLTKAAYGLIDNVVKHLDKGAELMCSAEDAAKTQEICTSLINKKLK